MPSNEIDVARSALVHGDWQLARASALEAISRAQSARDRASATAIVALAADRGHLATPAELATLYAHARASLRLAFGEGSEELMRLELEFALFSSTSDLSFSFELASRWLTSDLSRLGQRWRVTWCADLASWAWELVRYPDVLAWAERGLGECDLDRRMNRSRKRLRVLKAGALMRLGRQNEARALAATIETGAQEEFAMAILEEIARGGPENEPGAPG